MEYSFIYKQIKDSKSLARAYENFEFCNKELKGIVLDIGGGRNPDYFDYFNTSKVKKIIPIDGSISEINFENDEIPYDNDYADSVVCINLLEHIFNFQFVSNEIFRVMKPDGILFGAVPYLINYHPDPHDYFRYSKESLCLILSKSGFKNIEIVELGMGPFLVSLNSIIQSIPKFLRIVLFYFAFNIDKFYIKKGYRVKERFPLGYYFTATK